MLDVPGATGDLDTDYGAKARAAVAALAGHDFVFVHVEAPDEAGHMGDLREKVGAIERIDAEVLGPLLDVLAAAGACWCVPDHPTPVRLRTHTGRPVPFAFGAAPGPARRRRRETCSEAAAAAAGLVVRDGQRCAAGSRGHVGTGRLGPGRPRARHASARHTG